MTHLWEIEHSYYGAEGGGYYANGYQATECQHKYDSWAEFLEDWDSADFDMNLVYRFDWHDWKNSEYWTDPATVEDPSELDYQFEDELEIFYLGPRKGVLISCSIHVTKADEDAVRAWLTPRWEYVKKMWEPFG